jgi:hypothetical protein
MDFSLAAIAVHGFWEAVWRPLLGGPTTLHF